MNMKTNKRLCILIGLFVLIVLFFSLCLFATMLQRPLQKLYEKKVLEGETAPDVTKQNAVRQTLEIRQIKPDWQYAGREKHFRIDRWKERGAGYAKQVYYDAKYANILFETDEYYSGKSFMTREGQVWEVLSLTYDYNTSQFYINYVGQDQDLEKLINSLPFYQSGLSSGSYAKTPKETIDLVEEILTKWDRSRL